MFKGLSPLLTTPKPIYGGGIRGRGGVYDNIGGYRGWSPLLNEPRDMGSSPFVIWGIWGWCNYGDIYK